MNIPRLLSFFLAFTVAAARAGTPQSIGVVAVPDHLSTDAPFSLTANATSGLPVTCSIVSPPGVATLAEKLITLTGAAGAVTVKISQGGNATYDPAPDEYLSFTVGQATRRFVKLSAGASTRHHFGIAADGTLWGWGQNDGGQLGDGTTITRGSLAQVGTATNWSSIACGLYHTAALRSDGTLWAWGQNINGQVGDGSTTQRTSPVQIGTSTLWTAVACGSYHTLALRSDGTLWAWGLNSTGQLGDGSLTQRTSPVQVGTATNWSFIACGAYHSAALRAGGTLWAWGDNSSGQVGDGSTIRRTSPVQIGTATSWRSVACGASHSLAVRTDNSLWGWGSTSSSQLAGGSYPSQLTPVQVALNQSWLSVACGANHSLGFSTNNELYVWGENAQAQLGNPNGYPSGSPQQLHGASTFAAATGGQWHSVVLRSDGTVWSWGSNFYGQLGNGSRALRTSPGMVGTPATPWTGLACGMSHTAGIRADGTLWTWGSSIYGQLGVDTYIDQHSPVKVSMNTDWAAVSCGQLHTAATRANGTLWTWGGNTNGQLGDGTTSSRLVPGQVGTATNWTTVATGSLHTLALRADGTLWAWGGNTNGQLGDGTTTQRNAPVQVGTATNWRAVAAGEFHSLGLRTDGTLWAWGSNGSGRLGDTTTTQRNSPVQIGSATSWLSIACGAAHSAALRADGSFWTWGSNTYGQLGDGTTTQRTAPVQVGTGFSWSALGAGYRHTHAVRMDGTLWGSGENFGKIGDGTTIQRNSLTQVGTAASWSRVCGGSTHAAGLRRDGTFWTWGEDNTDGKLGNQNTTTTTSSRAWPARAAQAITAPAPGATLPLNRPVAWAPAATSGLPVTTTIVGSATLVGGVLTPTAAGTLILSLYQPGSAAWAEAQEQVMVFQVVSAPEIEVSGDGQPVLSGGAPATANLTDFGSVQTLGGSLVRTFTIANTGTSALTLGGVSFSGGQAADFTLATPPASSVPVGGTTTFAITFDPAADGLRQTTVTFATNDLDENPFTFGIRGTGIPQAISFPVVPDHRTTDAPLSLSASASSGLPVVFSLVGSASVATLNGDTLTLTGATGSVTVKASQPGDATYGPAADVYRTFIVSSPALRFTHLAPALGYHGAGIRADGTLWTWGSNSAGQLGDGTTTLNPSPVQVGTATTWTSAACGWTHSAAVRSDGTLWAWGDNTYNQVGDGTSTQRTSPVQVGTATNWTAVACGYYHTAALRSDGTLWAWGRNSSGQVGDGTTVGKNAPVKIGTATTWASLACGGYHTLAVRANGTLWAWGSNTSGQIGDGTFGNVRNAPVQVGAATTWARATGGGDHSAALRTDGTLWTWGNNFHGQLGDGTTNQLNSPVQNGTATTWTAVVAGPAHTAALRADGTAWAWGSNSDGQVGDGSAELKRTVPVQISTVGGTGSLVALSAGQSHTAALGAEGSLWTWGSEGSGQLASGTRNLLYAPVQVARDTTPGWSSLAAGSSHTLGLRADGTLWTWGFNTNGQLGVGTLDISRQNQPAQVGTDTWTHVAATSQHSAALRTDGTLWGWGSNGSGELGDGTTSDRTSPVQTGTATTWTTVECGQHHTVALRADGTLWAWGDNTYGQLGDGTTTDRSSPVQIGTVTTWSAIACGYSHTVALRSDGTLWAWGYNGFGQIGDNTTTNRLSPVQIGTVTTWTTIACGQNHTLALRSNGNLWGWGANASSQLGNGNVQANAPVQLGAAATVWASISAGPSHSAGLRANGTLWTWGGNTYGQVGSASPTTRSTPVQVGSAVNWTQIVCGGYHTMGLRSDGTLWGFGGNTEGQVGAQNTQVPARVWPRRAAQTLTFAALPGLTPGRPVTLGLSASSGLPVTCTLVGPATLVGDVLTPTGDGLITVAAYQNGDAAWDIADSVVRARVSTAPAPEITLLGNNVSIAHNDLAPTTADHSHFGNILTASGSVTRTYTVFNDGTADLTLGSLVLGGTHAADFTLTTAPGAALLAPGATTTFQITCDPSADGARQATLTLANNDPDEAPFLFAIQATGITRQQSWRLTHFNTTLNSGNAADTFDFDKDGLPNLIEFAFGLTPTSASSGAAQLPTPQHNAAAETFTLTFVEPPGVAGAGLIYSAVTSTGLGAGSWSTVPDTGSGTTHTFTVPTTGQPRAFIQLQVTAP